MLKTSNNRDQNRLDPLTMKGKGKVVMVDDIVAPTRPLDDRDHMSPQKGPAFVPLDALPMGALCLNLAHTDGDLRWSQIKDRDRMQNRFS